MGGAKVSDKLNLINNLIDKVDKILIGGGMAFTFYKAEDIDIGKSIYEKEMINQIKDINKNKIILPKDIQVTKNLEERNIKTVKPKDIGECIGVDIGKKTIKEFKKELEKANTILWNGPLGIFEIKEFSEGTSKIAKHISNLKGKFSFICGGDTLSSINKINQKKFTYISTGGGASLEFLSGKSLPGIKSLEENYQKFK